MPRLSKRVIDGLKPRQGDFIVFDDDMPGFGVRVMPSGWKSFVVQYRDGGRTQRITFGKCGTLTPDEARKEARKYLGAVAKGERPSHQRSTYLRAPTLNSVCDRFIEEHIKVRLKQTTQKEYIRCLDRFIRPALGAHKIMDISRADISALHHKYRDVPYQANRTLGVLSKLFNLSEIWGLRSDGSNPCRHVQKYPEQKKERFLSKVELDRLGQVLSDLEDSEEESIYVINAFRLLVLTGCRLSEIQTLKWSYITDKHMELPDTKTGARKIPLPPAAKEVLGQTPRLDDNEYVIAGIVPGQHLTDLQRPWRRIRTLAELENVRIHDLRHTYASNAVGAGMSIPMVGKLLGHTQIQTTMRYAHLADDPVREAADQVSQMLNESMTSTKPKSPHLRVIK